MPSFTDFSLQPATLSVLASMNIIEPTPIQSEAIPALLAGRDLVGQSATGSGKTLAYGIPLVERLARDKRGVQALILVPTRELAVQVNAVLSKLAANRRLTTALLVGGKPYARQISALRYGAQIIVGTPGRVKDHIEQGTLLLHQTRICVLDEADQMLDIGFAPIIEEILTHTPETRQMALFSATIPDWVVKLEQKFLKDPVKVDITPAIGGQSTIEQIAYQVPHDQKMAALCTLLQSAEGESTLIFGRTKFGVEKLGQQLSKLGFTVGTLHGNKSQHAREDVLSAFRRGHVQTLLATNVAARGLDIAGIYQVINYELPESSELFTHRIGRTGRMGRQGKAITLLVPADISKWRRMARNLGQEVRLQRLTINETAALLPLRAQPEGPTILERQPYDEPQPGRIRQAFATTQGREQENQQELYREQRPARSSKPAPRPMEAESYREQRPARSSRPAPRPMEAEPYREQWPARSSKPTPRAIEAEPYREQQVARGRKSFTPAFKREQDNEQWPVRDRKAFAQGRETGKFAQSAPGNYSAHGSRRHAQESNANRRPARTSTWQQEGFSQSEQFSASPARGSKRGAGKPARPGRATGGKPGTLPFVVTEAQARNKSVTTPVFRIRKNVAAKRSANR